MKILKTLFLLPFITFSLFCMDGKTSWQDLPAEMQLHVIEHGIQSSKTPKEAIKLIKSIGSPDSACRELIKQNCKLLIKNIAKKSQSPELLIALNFDSLAENWFKENAKYAPLYSFSSLSDALRILKAKKNLTRENSAVLIKYLARKFHVSEYKLAFELGNLAGKWFVGKGLEAHHELYWKQKGTKLVGDWIFTLQEKKIIRQGTIDPLLDVNFQDENGHTPLWGEVISWDSAIASDLSDAQLFLDLGADPDIQDNNGNTPLLVAASKGYASMVALLLKNGANPNIKNTQGKTALSMAKNPQVAKLLQGANGEPPIYFSKKESSAKEQGASGIQYTANDADPYVFSQLPPFVLSQLFNSGIENPTEQDAQAFLEIWQQMGQQLIQYTRNGHIDNMKQLLANGADPNFKGQDGQSVLLHACVNGKEEAAKLLLQYDVDPNDKDDIGCTPLMWASAKGMDSLIPLLLQKGARLNDKDVLGTNALMKACMSGNKKIIKKILKSKADVNATDEQGQTALVHAAQNERVTALEWLIRYGADVTIKDKSEKTAPEHTQNPKILALLTDKKGKIKVKVAPKVQKEKTKEEKIVANLLEMPFETDEDKMVIFSQVAEFKLDLLLAVNDLLHNNGSEKAQQIKHLVQQEINTQLGI